MLALTGYALLFIGGLILGGMNGVPWQVVFPFAIAMFGCILLGADAALKGAEKRLLEAIDEFYEEDE